MIRFGCPQCGKVLKIPEEGGGRPVICPRCQERCMAPAAEEQARAAEGSGRNPVPGSGLLSAMNWKVRAAVVLVAVVAALSLLLPVLSPLWSGRGRGADSAASWAMVLAPCSLALLLVILYGHATSCPSCQRWWARSKGETEFVEREVFEKGGVPFGRSSYRTTYECGSCRHRWSVESTDEYRMSERDRQRRKG